MTTVVSAAALSSGTNDVTEARHSQTADPVVETASAVNIGDEENAAQPHDILQDGESNLVVDMSVSHPPQPLFKVGDLVVSSLIRCCIGNFTSSSVSSICEAWYTCIYALS
jgi:hypothetical protein